MDGDKLQMIEYIILNDDDKQRFLCLRVHFYCLIFAMTSLIPAQNKVSVKPT